MALNLSAFLAENAVKPVNVKYVASERMIDPETGKPAEWEIRCLTSAEDEAIRRASIRRVPVPGRKNQFTNETDMNTYLGKLAVAATVFPPLTSAELQDNYKVKGAENLLKEMLTAGEYADYLAKVQQVCGFETTLQDEVNEAKN